MNEYVEFASRGKNAWWRYVLSLAAACLLAFAALTILTITLMLLRLSPSDIAAELAKPKHPWPFFLGIAVIFGVLVASLMVAVKFIQGKTPADVIGRWQWRLFVWGASIWAAVQGVLVLIDFLIAPKGFSVSIGASTASLAAAALVGLLVQTFAEEFLFRGYITQGLLLLLRRPLPAALVSGLLFGSLHIANGLPQALNAIVFGVVCSLIAIRTGGIALTWGLHLVNNYFGAVVVVSASDVFNGSPGIISQNTPQLVWWDLCLAVLAIVALLLPVARSRYFPPSAMT